MTHFNTEMSILEALELHPGARAVFERHGMTCCVCMGATSESVAAGAIMHNLEPDTVVAELNRLVQSEAS
jgi:hybrid cluster-associated redox disulfide protein